MPRRWRRPHPNTCSPATLGAPYTYPSDVTVHKEGKHSFTVNDVDWDGKPFENPIYYGARIVRWFGEAAAPAPCSTSRIRKPSAQLDEDKTFSGTLDGAPAPERAKLGDVFRRLEASHGHNMLTLNGLFRLPSIGLRLHPYVGIGAGVALPHSEVQMIKDPGRTYEYQYAGPVGQALIGIEFRVPRMSYFFEYKFTLASYQMPLTHQDGDILFTDLWRQFKRWLSGEEPPGGFLVDQPRQPSGHRRPRRCGSAPPPPRCRSPDRREGTSQSIGFLEKNAKEILEPAQQPLEIIELRRYARRRLRVAA